MTRKQTAVLIVGWIAALTGASYGAIKYLDKLEDRIFAKYGSDSTNEKGEEMTVIDGGDS